MGVVKRRDLVSGLASAALFTTAGCIADGGSPAGAGGPDKTDTPDGEDTPTGETPATDSPTDGPDDGNQSDGGTDDTFEFDPASEDPFESVTLGSREGLDFATMVRPKALAVWNDADAERSLDVAVTRNGESTLDRTVAFPADEWFSVRLAEPADWSVEVALDGDVVWSRSFPPSAFDCNGTTTHVAVGPDGTVETSTLSTALGCHDPVVASTEFERRGSDCGGENRANVTFDDERVTVEGTVRTPTPCYGLELAETAYDAEADELRVVVAVGDSQDGVCTDCVGEVRYRAGVAFEHGYPGTVVIEHESAEETTQVTTARPYGGSA